MERKLTAILAADVVGYSRLMEADEAETLAALMGHRQDLIDPEIAKYNGRLIKLMGDGALVEFASVVDAVACAVAIQEGMAARDDDLPEDRRIEFRIGVHLGDVMVEDDDLYGDGVNVAARLEGLAEPGGTCISQQALDQVETKLDLAYEDLGEQQVKNIARPVRAYRVRPQGVTPRQTKMTKRRGWSTTRLVGSAAIVVLTVAGLALGWWQPWKPEVAPASIERMAFPLPDKPSIAVLPFDNMSGDPGQDYFADGMTEDLITDLSKISGLFVIARNSTFAYKGKPVKVQQVAEELGVRYVLEGSVRRSGNQVRINAQLVDATTGVHLWADRYDGTLEDVFALQDEVSQKIVSALAVTLTPDEQQQLSQAAKAHPEAYDLLLRGLERFRRYTRETNVEAREYFERAVAIDPDFARAHADIALTHAEDAFHGWADSPERSSQLALEKAQHALRLDNNSRVARFALAYTYLNMKRYDEALAENRRELDLDPNHAEGRAQRGLILNYVGRPAEGLDAIRTAMRLDPRYPFFYVWILGQAHFLLRQTEEAIAQFEKVIESNPDFAIGHIMLASAYAHAGRIENAEWEAEEVLVLLPDFTLAAEREKVAYKNPSHLEYYLDGLRKAGIPEKPPLTLPDKPSIAVLPFDNMSTDPEQEYFADGMTEDLITDLAKISGLLVIARNSTFAYKGQSPDVREVARQLNVRYVVEGSVRKAGGRIRINAQLIDAETGAHLWAERYDREATDVFDLQDEVRAQIVAALRVKLTPAEATRLARPLTSSPEAYDYWLRGLRQESFFTKEGNLESRRMFERAIELDPAFATAFGRLATAHTLAAESGWSPAPEESMETARLLAEKAIALDDDLPQAHWAMARVYSRWRLFDGERAIASLRKAIALDPNYADGHAFLAIVLGFVGRAEEALGHVETAMRLNPHFPFWYYYALGASQFMLTRYDAAIESLEKAIERNPTWTSTHRILVAAYGQLGMIDEAEWEMEELRMLGFEPTLANWRSRIQIQDPAYLARYFNGLRKAGVPE